MPTGDAAYHRQWRAKRGARTGQPGRPATEPCGTTAAYKRHRRNGETTCEACRTAWAAYQRELYRRRRAKAASRTGNKAGPPVA